MSTRQQIIRAQKHAENNWESVHQSKTCGCFYCGHIFPAADARWWDPGFDFAACPRCYTGAVIADASGLPVTPEFLALLRGRLFDEDEAAPSRKLRPYRCKHCRKIMIFGYIPEDKEGIMAQCPKCGRLQYAGGPEVELKSQR